jgi:hypothetical protein
MFGHSCSRPLLDGLPYLRGGAIELCRGSDEHRRLRHERGAQEAREHGADAVPCLSTGRDHEQPYRVGLVVVFQKRQVAREPTLLEITGAIPTEDLNEVVL